MYTNSIRSVLLDTLTLNPAFNSSVLSDSLSDTVEFVPGPFKDVTVNGYTFAANAGFPSTGFDKATFKLNMPAGKIASNYTWTSDQTSWATVSASGVVTLAGVDAAPVSDTKSVVIFATPKSNGLTLKYTFTVTNWFVTSGSATDYVNSSSWCSGKGRIMPPLNTMTNAVAGSVGTRLCPLIT